MLEIHVGQSSPCLHHIQTYAVQHHQHCNIKGRSFIDFKRKGINKITRFANIYYQNNSNLLLSCFLTNLICILFTNDSNLLLSIFLFLNFSKYFFWRSTFVGSVWSFGFSIPATTANDLRLRRIFYPRFYPLHFFLS